VLAGTTQATILIRIRGGVLAESDETFFVNLINPRFATILDDQGVGTIRDNDP